jgi:D-3-phosphoglycerate dehydrogenase
MVGQIGTLLGARGVNIASMNLGRDRASDRAVSLVGVDSAVDAATLAELAGRPGIESATLVSFEETARPGS